MRGAGGTPRGFRAHQNNLRRGRRTNEIRRTAPNRQTRQRKAARSNKPIFFSIADAITAGGSPKIIRRANQEVVRHRTQPPHNPTTSNQHQTDSNRYPSSTQDETNTDRQRQSESYRVKRVVRTTITEKGRTEHGFWRWGSSDQDPPHLHSIGPQRVPKPEYMKDARRRH